MLNNDFRFEGRALTEIRKFRNDGGFEYYSFELEVETNGGDVEVYEIRAYVNSKTITPDLEIKGRQIMVGGYHKSFKTKEGAFIYSFQATEIIATSGSQAIHSNSNNPRAKNSNSNSYQPREDRPQYIPPQQEEPEITENDLPF